MCYLLNVCSERKLEGSSLRISYKFYNRLYLVWSLGRNSDCDKRGQTSRPVVGTEIQTSCDFKANLRYHYYPLGCVLCLLSNVVLESRDNLVVWYHSTTSVSSNLGLFLHKDFL